MPRPSLAQTIYGSATVTSTAFVLLLVTRAQSGTGAVLVASASLLLGLLVATVLSTTAAGRRTATAAQASPRTEAPATGASTTGPRVPQASLRR